MLEEMMQLVRLREGQGLVHNGNGGPVNPSNLPPAAFVRPASQEGEAGARSLPQPTADLRHPTLLAEHLPSKCVRELPRHAATARLLPVTRSHRVRKTMRLGLQKTRCHEVC